MAKRAANPDAILDRLAALRQVPSSPEFLSELKKALAHASVVVVARGAELSARYEKRELIDHLVAAYERFSDPRSSDGNYIARTAIVRGLVDLYAGGAAADVFVAAAGVGAGSRSGVMLADPAAELRSTSAFGLAALGHPAALTVCTDLLADNAGLVRVAAARALANTGREGAVLVLRLKLHVGDSDPEVLAECAAGLMQLAPEESLDVVRKLLAHPEPPARGGAALALGSSKRPDALRAIQEAFERETEDEVCATYCVAVASSRLPMAVEWLVSLVARDRRTADAAIAALGPYRLDAAVMARVTNAARQNHGNKLDETLTRVFG